MNSFGLFDTVIGGPAAAPYAVGWALLLVGTLASLALGQVRTMKGSPGANAEVLARFVLGAVGLGLFTFISKVVWWATQSLAHSIYPDTKLQAMGRMLAAMAGRFREHSFSFSVTGFAEGLRDSFVMLCGLTSWLLGLLAHWQIQQTQQAVYNVIFCFGPILIGLSGFGLPTARIWLTSLLEVSSWSITAAVLYHGISSQIESYAADPGAVMSTRFLDVTNTLVFFSSMMVVIPVVTGRLLGMSALGDIGRAVGGQEMVNRVSSLIQSFQPDGVRAAPDMRPGGRPTPPARGGF
jgi:hypothetical protein